MEQALQLLDSIEKLEPGLRALLLNSLDTIYPDKDEILLREGSTARTIGFIEKGMVRGFWTTKNDIEKTCWFMKEGDVFASIWSFFEQRPANETLQALEPCIIHVLSFDKLNNVYAKFPSFQLHRAELLQRYYLLSLKREEMRQQEDGYDRFCYLVQHFRNLIDRVPDKYLASYISTIPSYFSTLKHRYLDEHGHL
jgi:CRP-like cAMP-binding protein